VAPAARLWLTHSGRGLRVRSSHSEGGFNTAVRCAWVAPPCRGVVRWQRTRRTSTSGGGGSRGSPRIVSSAVPGGSGSGSSGGGVVGGGGNGSGGVGGGGGVKPARNVRSVSSPLARAILERLPVVDEAGVLNGKEAVMGARIEAVVGVDSEVAGAGAGPAATYASPMEGDNVSVGAGSGEADDRRSSQFIGVSWNRSKKQWAARHTVNGKRVSLGHHATEQAAVEAINQYYKDGVDLVKHRGVRSQFKGVSWQKGSGTWRAECKRKKLGYHDTEEGAARAYNKEAERIGLVDLNVIPPAGDGDAVGGDNTAAAVAVAATAAVALPRPATPARVPRARAGSKRATPTAPAPKQAKTLPAEVADVSAAGPYTRSHFSSS